MITQTSGRTALITGASSGIGQELAKLFAQDGYNLVLVGRSEDQLHRLADVFTQNYGTEHTTVIGKDLAKENAAQELYDEVKAKGITVNVLVNDAGLSTYGKFANETDWEAEKDIIHLNTVTLTHLTKLYLKEMVQRNEGRVLNLASLVSITPMPLMAVYAATKSYVYNFTASLVNELKGTNVTVTALMPNATDTDFFNKAGASDIKVTDELQDPVMVAKAGYEALMNGEPKVVPGGIMNKMYEVMGHIAPQQAVAGLMRSKMERKPTPEQQRQLTWAWGVGIAAVIVAGVVVAALLTGDDDEKEVADATYDEIDDQYETEIAEGKHKAKSLLAEAIATFGMARGRVADTTSHFADEARETFGNAKDKLTDVAAQTSDSVGSTAKNVAGKFTDAQDNFTNRASNTISNAKSKLSDARDEARSRFDEAKDAASRQAGNTYKTAKGKLSDAKSDARDKFYDVADETTDKWAAIKNIVTKVVVNALS